MVRNYFCNGPVIVMAVVLYNCNGMIINNVITYNSALGGDGGGLASHVMVILLTIQYLAT